MQILYGLGGLGLTRARTVLSEQAPGRPWLPAGDKSCSPASRHTKDRRTHTGLWEALEAPSRNDVTALSCLQGSGCLQPSYKLPLLLGALALRSQKLPESLLALALKSDSV